MVGLAFLNTPCICGCLLWQMNMFISNVIHYTSVRTRPKKLISGDCYTIFNLISSDLKLISTLYVDFYEAR